MQNIWRRSISMFLAVVMILSNVPLQVLAQETVPGGEETIPVASSTVLESGSQETAEPSSEPETSEEVTETTEAPTETTEAPTETTEAPTETTQAPPETTEAPPESSEASEPPVDEALQAVQAMIDALEIPDMDNYKDGTDEENQAAYEAALEDLKADLYAIDEAAKDFTEEQDAQIDGTKYSDAWTVINEYWLSTLVSETAEADGWYWEESTLYILDGKIQEKNLYAAILTKQTSASAIKYATSKPDWGWSQGGTTLSNSSTAVLSLSGSYAAGCKTGKNWYISVKDVNFTVVSYYLITAGTDVTLDADYAVHDQVVNVSVPHKEGFEPSAEYNGGTVVLTRNGDVWTGTLKAAASGAVTVTYKDASATKYTVSVAVDGAGKASADVKEGTSGTAVTITATPNSGSDSTKHYLKSITVNGEAISGNSFKIGEENAEVKVTFGTVSVGVAAQIKSIGINKTTKDVSGLKTKILVAAGIDPTNSADYIVTAEVGIQSIKVTADATIEDGSIIAYDIPVFGDQNVKDIVASELSDKTSYIFTITKKAAGNVPSVTQDVTIPIEDIYRTVTYMDDDNQLSESGTELGATPTVAAAASEDGHAFQNWNTAADGTGTVYNPGDTLPPITANVTLYAQWKAEDCTIIWVDGNGNTLKTDTVAYGTIPAYDGAAPTKDQTASTVYTWNNGWNPAVAAVTGNTTYTATFTKAVRKYTISWDTNGDGEVDKTTQVDYNTLPEAPAHADRTAEDLSPNGWYPEIVNVSGDAAYTAQYSEDTVYTVKFLAEGKEHSVQYINVTQGETVTTPADPTADQKIFNGWDKAIVEVPIADTTYTAQWLPDENRNGVDDNNEQITVTISGEGMGSVTIDGAAAENGKSYLYDSTKGAAVVVAPNADTASIDYSYTIRIGDAEQTVNAENTYTVSSGSVTVSVAFAKRELFGGKADVSYHRFLSTAQLKEAIFNAVMTGSDPEGITVDDVVVQYYPYEEYTLRGTSMWVNYYSELTTLGESVPPGKDAAGSVGYYNYYPFGAQYLKGNKTTEKVRITGTGAWADLYVECEITLVDTRFDVTVTKQLDTAVELDSLDELTAEKTAAWFDKDSDGKLTVDISKVTLPEDGKSEEFTVTVSVAETATYKPYSKDFTVTVKNKVYDPQVRKVWVDENTAEASLYFDEACEDKVMMLPSKMAGTYYIKVTPNEGYDPVTPTVTTNDENITVSVETIKVVTDVNKENGAIYGIYKFEAVVHNTQENWWYYPNATSTIRMYTVKWVNGETTLETDRDVKHFTNPTFDQSQLPTKDGDAQYTYTFKGWTIEGGGETVYTAEDLKTYEITGDTTFIAYFEETVNQYKVTWENEGVTTTVKYGDAPVFDLNGDGEKDADPTKQATAEYTYTFDGWTNGTKDEEGNLIVYGTTANPLPPVTGDVTYLAHFAATINKYTITWLNGDGGIYTNATEVKYGTVPTMPTIPAGYGPNKTDTVKYKYTFNGNWELTAGALDENGGILGDVTYTACFDEELQEYKYYFAAEEGQSSTVVTSKWGEKLPVEKIPVALAKEGYTFLGWKNRITEVVYTPDQIPPLTEGDAWYLAEYSKLDVFTVQVFLYGDTWGTPVQVIDGYLLQEASLAGNTRPGYRLAGWNDENGESFDFTKPITADTTVYAQWVRIVNVTFNANGGTLTGADKIEGIDVYTLIPADKIPTDPKRDDYRFDGWYLGNSEFDFSKDELTEDITLTAQWTALWNVTFANTTIEAVKDVPNNTTITAPADPTRDGYNFGGWYADASCTVAFNFGDPITKHTTVYAKWNKLYTVTFDTSGGDPAVEAQIVEHGSKAAAPADKPDRINLTFVHWYVKGGNSAVAYNFDTAVTSDITLVAHYGDDSDNDELVDGTPADPFHIFIWKDKDGEYHCNSVKVLDGASLPADPEVDTNDNGLLFTGWDETITGQGTGEITYTHISQWVADENNNDVADSKEMAKVTIVGNGTVTLGDGAIDKGNGQWLLNTKSSHTLTVTPTDWSTAYNYVESVMLDGAELTNGNTGFSNGAFTTSIGISEKNTPAEINVTFGQRSLSAKSATVYMNSSYASPYEINLYVTKLNGTDWSQDEYPRAMVPAPFFNGSAEEIAEKGIYLEMYHSAIVDWSIAQKWDKIGNIDTVSRQASFDPPPVNKQVRLVWPGDGSRYPDVVSNVVTANVADSYRTVTYKNGEQSVADGTELGATYTVIKPDAITKAGHTFTGWQDSNGKAYAVGDTIEINTNVTLHAQWSVNYYTITWQDGNGNTLATTSAAYGTVPTAPTFEAGKQPVKDSTVESTFTWNGGWEGGLQAVTGDTTYTADFTSKAREYTITWDTNGDLEDGVTTTVVPYGTVPTAPATADRKDENKSFAGWDGNNDGIAGENEVVAVTGEAFYNAIYSDDTFYTVTFLWEENGQPYNVQNINVTQGKTVQPVDDPDKAYAIFTSWTNANVIGTVPTGNVTLVAQWDYDDSNDNNVKDTGNEIIKVQINGDGSVTIDGDPVSNGTYVFDSTKAANSIKFIPKDVDGSDGSANFVESAKVGMASENTNLATNGSYSNYALTVDRKFNNGERVEATFGTRTLNVRNIEVGINGYGTTVDKGKVAEAYMAGMTAKNLVTVPAQETYGSEFVVYLKYTAIDGLSTKTDYVDATKLNDKSLGLVHTYALALDGPPATKNGYVKWNGDSRYPTIQSAEWTANIVDIRPQASIEIGQLPADIAFDSASEIEAAILAATKMYYEDGNGQKVYVENLASVLDVTLDGTILGYGDSVSEDWTTDGKTQTLKYKVGPKTLDFAETPYVKPNTTTVTVKATGKVHPAKVTVASDAAMGTVSIASGDFDAHQYTNYTVPFTVTPADGCYVESVTVNDTALTGSYANTVFSASFPIVNGDVTDGTETVSTYEVVVTYGKRSLVAKQTINPITYNPDMAKIREAVYSVAVDTKASAEGTVDGVMRPVTYGDVKIDIKPAGQTIQRPAENEVLPYTFVITWPASADGKYPERTMEVTVEVIAELKFNVDETDDIEIGDYTEGDYADYLASMEAKIRSLIKERFPYVYQDDIKIDLPKELPILAQGEKKEIKVPIHVYGGAEYGESDDVAVFTLTGMVETAVVKVETAQGGDVKHTAPVAAANTNHVFEAVPAENFFLDTMTITRQDVAPGQTAAVAEADPTFPMSLTWQDFTNGKKTVTLPNGDGLALGVVPTYTVTAAFVDPAIVIEANREVGFNPFWEDLEGELLKQLTKEQEDGSAPVAAATPEQLLTVPAVPEAVGETNEVKVEYRVREEAEYTVQIALDFIDLPIISDYLKGKTIDIPMTLEELWASPDQEFASKEVDVEQLIKDSYDEIVNMSDLPTPDLSDISGYISKLTEYFTGKFNALLDPYRDGMFVHNFGDMRDENGAKTNTEIIRITSTSARFGKVVSDSQVVTLKDIRTETALTLTNPSVTMTYGFPEADLTAALVPVITALAEEGEQVIDGSIVYVDKVADLDASDTAYTITVRYPGSYDYQDAEAKATVLVNKDSATVTVESKTMKYTGKPADVSFTAVGNTYGKNADMAKFIVGLNVSDFGVDFENKTVVGLEGDLILILPESIQKWLDLIPGFDGVDMEINELGDALNTILEMLGVGGEGSSDVINSLLNVLNMLPEAVDLRITLGDDSHMPSDIGVYLTGAVTLDSNFETAFNVGYLLITPDGYQAELGWIMEDSNGIISHDLLQNKEIFDMGPKVLSVLEGTVEEAQQYATQIFLGISVNNAANGNNTIDEIILTTDQTQLPFGAYVEIGLLTDFGNTMYYAVPVVRAFAVIPETVKVELLDANGNQNRDLKLDFNGQPQGFEVKVSDREGNLILNTFENVGSTEHLILKYYGLKTNIETYDSSDKPDHSGGYAALAVYLEKDAAGNIQAFGVDVGAMVIEPSKSTIAVGDDVKVYDGKSYDVAALIDAKSVNVPALTPDTTVVTAQLTTDMSFEQNGLGAIQGAANMDFPVWLDKILSEKYPDAFANGINAGDFAAKLAQYTDKLKELGITEEMLAELTNVLNSIPSDVRLTFHDLADVAPTEIGAYVVVGIVTDPNHYPAVDAGLLVITPATTEAVLKFTDNDSNNIYMVDTLKFKDLNADAYVNDVYNEDATALVTNLFVGININGETVTTTDYTTLLPGEYLQLSYILDLRQELYYAVPITRLITVAPNLYDISIWNNGVEDPFRQHTYDATPKSIGDIKITDQKGQPVTVNADEGDDLTVTYYGVNLPVEGYKSTDLPTDAGAYVALVTFVDYDENGSCIGVGITAGAMIINLADGTLVVEEDTVTYNGLEQFPKVTLRSGNLVEETDCAAIIVETYTDHSVEPAAQAKQMRIVLDDDLRAMLKKAEDLLGYEIPEVIDTPEVLTDIVDVLKKVTSVTTSEELQSIMDLLPEDVRNKVDDILAQVNPAAEELITLLETAAAVLPEVMPEAATVLVDSAKPVDAGTYEIYALSVSKNFMPEMMTQPAVFQILPVDINVAIQDAEKFYGDPDPALAYAVTYTDVDGETVTLDYLPEVVLDAYATMPMPVRNQKHTIVVSPDALLKAEDKRNFTINSITGTAGQNAYLNIKPAEVSVSVADQTKVYGEVDPEAPYTWEVFKGKVTEEELKDVLELVVARIAGENVGSYDYSLSYLDCAYITVTADEMGALTITPAPLSVTVKDAEKLCLAPNPAFDYEVQGLVNEDDKGSVVVTYSCETGRNTAGTYPINATAENDNYDITVIPGTLTICHSEQTMNAVDPTCTDTGLTEGTKCSACGEILTAQETVDALGHDWNETTYTWTGYTACTAERVCKRDAGHKLTLSAVITEEVTIAPLCESEGLMTYTAAFDTDWAETQAVTQVLNALGHDWDDGKITDSTCTAEGEKLSTCRNDSSHTKTEVIKKKEHQTEFVFALDPTCTEPGHNFGFRCAVCKTILDGMAVTPATGHDYDDGVITTQPTCTTEGVKTFTCSNDSSHTYTETVSVIAHSYTTVVTAPTCTERGYTTYTCSCGDSHVDDYVDALSHSFGEWYESKAPSCTEKGEERRDCGKCSHFETREAEKAAHSYSAAVTAPTCTERGYTTYTCSCGDSYVDDYVNALGHSYTAVVTAPTCEADGYTTYTCVEGDHSYVGDHQNATGHNYVGEVTTQPTCTETGVKTFTCKNDPAHTYTSVVAATGHDYQTKVTAPTCTEQGYTTYTCACGSSYDADYVDATDHAWDNGKVTTAPACTANGEMTFTCGNDSTHTRTEPIPATGHIDEDKDYVCDVCGEKLCKEHQEQVISGYAAACEASGLTDGKKCSICGEILVPQTVISATGHNYVGEVTTEPTCTETGVKTYVCQNDKSHTYTEDVPAAGHSYSAAVTAPTCTEQGYTTHTCACGESYQDTYVDALGHDWNLGVITELPSCTDTGVRTYTCRNDKSHTYTEEIPAIGHSHSAVITAPTCTERGYTTYTCICGDSYVDDYVAATGHTYGQWKQTTAPSCTDEGEERRDCVHCDAFETRKVAVTDHTYTSVVTAPTCTEKGYTTHTCACGHSYKDTYVAAAGHDMGQWTEVKAPTCTESGTERRDCAACDHFEERELKATGHTLGAWYQSKAPDCTDKGEDRRDCAECDYFETKEVEATGHSFGEWYESKAATPSKPGEERRDCANCDHFETREIPALGRITITKDHVKLGTKLTYNGKEQTKKLTITVDGKTLVEGTDFTVTGRTGTDAGSYTMTITGLGDYTGTVGVKWNIYARKVTVKLDSHTVKVGDKLPKWTYKVTTGTVAEGDTLKLTITCKAKDTKKTGTYSITGKDNDPNYEITVKSGKLTVVENRDGLYPVYFDPNVSIAPGAEVEIDGVPYTLDNDSIAWLDHEDAKLATSYKFKENDDPHKTYPTHMYVWLLTLEDSDGDGKKDCYQAERVTELDNFMMYHGTSIRVNHTSNGIRFFTSMPSGSLDKLISGKLLTGSLKGYKLVRAGTLFKWYEGDDTVTLDNAVSSDVYGGKAGKNFRVYQSSNGRDWFTGMLTGLEGDAKTLNRDLLARPFMVLERNGKQITIYGGTIQRSIYYVATQNRNHWAAGTVYDNYVEDIIAKAEKGKS